MDTLTICLYCGEKLNYKIDETPGPGAKMDGGLCTRCFEQQLGRLGLEVVAYPSSVPIWLKDEWAVAPASI